MKENQEAMNFVLKEKSIITLCYFVDLVHFENPNEEERVMLTMCNEILTCPLSVYVRQTFICLNIKYVI